MTIIPFIYLFDRKYQKKERIFFLLKILKTQLPITHPMIKFITIIPSSNIDLFSQTHSSYFLQLIEFFLDGGMFFFPINHNFLINPTINSSL
jgi:hypothetical protein